MFAAFFVVIAITHNPGWAILAMLVIGIALWTVGENQVERGINKRALLHERMHEPDQLCPLRRDEHPCAMAPA
jgi:hypothetical protein